VKAFVQLNNNRMTERFHAKTELKNLKFSKGVYCNVKLFETF